MCDIAAGTSCDCQLDGIPDECQLRDLLRDILALDDGSSENNWGLTAGGAMCWMNHFTQGSPGSVDNVLCTFGSPLYPGSPGVAAGDAIRVFVWDDPAGNGNAAEAVFVGEGAGVVDAGSIDTDVVQAVPAGFSVGTSFFVGASVVTTSGYPASADDDGWTGAPNQAFLTFNDIPFDPTNITASLYAMGDLGYPQTVFILRADVSNGPLANDCNANGIPDECDIAIEFGGFCGGGVPPCFPETCDSDWNHNGVPDHCPGEVCGDLNGDGVVDIDDYWIFVGGFGTCDGDIKYVPLADFDGDFCITLVDYRSWRMCYKMYNGYNFVAPKYVPTPDLKPVKAGQAK